jgi:ornithine carbamoyltransferase
MKRFNGKDFLSLHDYSRDELYFLLHTAQHMNSQTRAGIFSTALKDKALGMVFQKPSLRTRVSFQVGMHQLGGTALYLSPEEIQLGKREAVKDVARVLSRYVDGIMARVFSHEDLLELAEHASVPVINGLSDLLHPCQGLADYLTIMERFGAPERSYALLRRRREQRVPLANAWGCQVRCSYAYRMSHGYGPDDSIITQAEGDGLDLTITGDPEEGVRGPMSYTPTHGSPWGRNRTGSARCARLKDSR